MDAVSSVVLFGILAMRIDRKRGERGEGRRRKDKAIDEAEEDYRPRAETVWWCSGCENGANVRRTERKRGGGRYSA